MAVPSILAVVRDRVVTDFLKQAAVRAGAELVATRNPGDALARAHARPPKAVVVGLDLEAPALALVRQFRSDLDLASTPVLLIGRPGQESRAAAGLEVGAVGFLQLPLEEVAVAARLREVAGWSLPEEHVRLVLAGPVTLDLASRRLLRPRPTEALTRCEFEMLRWLMMPPGRTYTRRQLVAANRAAYPPLAEEWMVDANVVNLRRKLGPAGDWIECVAGVGYRFAAPAGAGISAPSMAISS